MCSPLHYRSVSPRKESKNSQVWFEDGGNRTPVLGFGIRCDTITLHPRLSKVASLLRCISHRWSSGMMHPCHGCDPGSIPGRCTFFISCKKGPFRESNAGPLRPERRIMPLDQTATLPQPPLPKNVASPAGLEPAAFRLTAERTADCATETSVK